MTLFLFSNVIQKRGPEVEAWLAEQWKGLVPAVYLSCDIRHSGFKIGVVDTNLFPAGFNNLCPSFSRQTSQAFHDYLDTHYPKAKKILIYAEEHTRNKYYLKNLMHLQALLDEAGRQVAIGVKGDFMSEGTLKIAVDEAAITLLKASIHVIPAALGGNDKNRLTVEGFDPDLILLNNDLSSGVPEILSTLAQPIIPPLSMGWHARRKSHHFGELQKLLADFAGHFELDPWLFTPLTDAIDGVDIDDETTLPPLAAKVDALLARISKKYAEYGITESPYVYVKSDVGTYGLGLLPVFSGDEILSLNRKKRGKLSSSKGNVKVSSYLIQEGIPTNDFYSGYPIEPVIYVVGKKDVGGFFRIHESKNEWESLNSPGMSFSCLCLHKLTEPHEEMFLDCQQKENVVTLSRFLARMASLAAARESKDPSLRSD